MYQAILPNDEDYEQVKAAVESAEANTGMFDYNGLTTFLNNQPARAIVPTKLKKGRKASLIQQMAKRGLQNQVDLAVTVVDDSEDGADEPNEVLVVTKLSDKEGEIIQHQRRGRPPRSENADD